MEHRHTETFLPEIRQRERYIQNNGISENKHFEFILAFDYILVIRNDASYITVILIQQFFEKKKFDWL